MPANINDIKGENQSAFAEEPNLYNKKIEAIPKPETILGVDNKQSFYQNIINEGTNGAIDMSVFENFFTAARGRDEVYSLIDVMSEDSTISAILETYAEDATEYNEEGHIMWAESADPKVSAYVNFLLDSMNVDKHAYKWVYTLAKYGDLYLRLYRKSDYEEDDGLFEREEDKNKRQHLQEDIKLNAYDKNDHYVHYLGVVNNPAEYFELTKFDKSYAYIKAEINSVAQQRKSGTTGAGAMAFYHYDFKQKDIEVFDPKSFVHGCLEDNVSRIPEEVTITKEGAETKELTYQVKRGQSLLYPVFKIWRELALLENVILLNRVTKSAIVKVVNIEVGDMPKENVAPHLQSIKSLLEQKSNLNTGKSFGEYTNPGPVENIVYVPTRGGIGALSVQQIGGEDLNIGKLSDVEYFQDKFFGAVRVPKQYFGILNDNAGFSGGQSLSLISARYAKAVKRLQNTTAQTVTDAVNLMLMDVGLESYVNQFTIKMTPPITQEEIDRREAATNKVRLASDVMNLFTNDIEDPVLRLKALKELLSGVAPGTDLAALIQEAIEQLENEIGELPSKGDETSNEEDINVSGDIDLDVSDEGDLDTLLGVEEEGEESSEESENSDEDASLPSMADLGDIDFTNNNNPEFNI